MEVFKVFDSEIIQKYSPDMFLVCWDKASPLTVFFPPRLSRTSGTHSQLRSDTALKFIFLIHVIKLHGGIRERHKKKKKKEVRKKKQQPFHIKMAECVGGIRPHMLRIQTTN